MTFTLDSPFDNSPFADVRELLTYLVDCGDIDDSDLPLSTRAAAWLSLVTGGELDKAALAEVCSLGIEYLININDTEDEQSEWALSMLSDPDSARDYVAHLST